MTDPPIDLLGARRQELGLPTTSPRIQASQALLLKGGLFAGFFVLATGAALLFVFGQERSLQVSIEGLRPIAQRADQVNQQLAAVRQATGSLNNDLVSMTRRLVAIQSGSALMEQLKRVTPASVQLTSVVVSPSQMQVSGLVISQPTQVGPLEQLNALALNFESLAGVPVEGARLQQAVRGNEALIDFEMLVEIDQSHQPTPDELSDLGADGLARRHRWLRAKGLPL